MDRHSSSTGNMGRVDEMEANTYHRGRPDTTGRFGTRAKLAVVRFDREPTATLTVATIVLNIFKRHQFESLDSLASCAERSTSDVE